jgi:hypothetical protein
VDTDSFLSRFTKVRGGNGKWSACCPAHEDRDPSLSIGIHPDGRILINCHAGCPPDEVLAAVGLTLSDLFPDRGIRDYLPGAVSRRERGRANDERMVIEVARADLAAGKKLSYADQRRVLLAAKRLDTLCRLPNDRREYHDDAEPPHS